MKGVLGLLLASLVILFLGYTGWMHLRHSADCEEPHLSLLPAVQSQRGAGSQKLAIAPGPNNPVGLVWIDLTKPSYGIHGTPRPEEIGKTQSHGCIRLTNWDALDLAKRVRKGTPVAFLDETQAIPGQ